MVALTKEGLADRINTLRRITDANSPIVGGKALDELAAEMYRLKRVERKYELASSRSSRNSAEVN